MAVKYLRHEDCVLELVDGVLHLGKEPLEAALCDLHRCLPFEIAVAAAAGSVAAVVVEVAIAFVGRARADKGILELISAFSALEADDWSLELGLAVQTEDERQLFDRLKGQISASDTINIRKNLSSTEVRDLLSRSAIAALPSIVEEGFHRAVIEAMACGCATIATQRGGAPEAAGTAGVLLPPLEGRALSQELQATLKQLIEIGEERQRLSDIGRQHALERADIDVIADQHFKILQSI